MGEEWTEWSIDVNSLDLAVFCAAAAFLGADLCPHTQPSLCLPQSRPHSVRESLRSQCDPGNFRLCVPERGREGDLVQRRVREEGRGEKGVCFRHC